MITASYSPIAILETNLFRFFASKSFLGGNKDVGLREEPVKLPCPLLRQVIDTATNTIIVNLPTGDFPFGVAITPILLF